MSRAKIALLALLAVSAGACDDRAAAGAPDAGGKALSPSARATTPKPATPLPGSVLNLIYGGNGHGAASYEVDFGSRVTFWYGHAFDFKGKRYFTGFAYKTPEKVTDEEKDAAPDPDAGVAISQATFVLDTSRDKESWSLLETDGYVGAFGTGEQAESVDPKRAPQTYQTGDGRLLLAVPTTSFSTGVTVTGFALFLFDPDEVAKIREKHWAYVGGFHTGEDNGAACAGGGVMPCAASTGTLTFGRSGDGLPALRVTMTGMTITGPGKTRRLGAADTKTYTYHMDKDSYTP